jgi:hypothetical protein
MPYALVFVHDHPQRDTFPQQQAFFNERILPMVQAMPGFVAGNWGYDPGPSRTHSYVVFDTEEHGRALLQHVRDDDGRGNPFGVKLISAALVQHTMSKP